MKKINFILLTSMTLALIGCSQAVPAERETKPYEDINVETLATMMEESRDSFLLINTHIPFEGNIPSTDLSVPYNEISAYLDKLPADKDAEIVLYCRSDSMSRSAAEDLSKLGYTNLKNLAGGFNAWNAAGLPFNLEP